MKKISSYLLIILLLFSVGCSKDELNNFNEQLLGVWESTNVDSVTISRLVFTPNGEGILILEKESASEEFTSTALSFTWGLNNNVVKLIMSHNSSEESYVLNSQHMIKVNNEEYSYYKVSDDYSKY